MVYSSDDIKKILPHRYPFLLVDRIEEIKVVDGKNTVVGIKCVTANEPFFQGHFPEFQVMPGVLIIEALAQCGAVHLLSMDEYKGKIAFLAGVDNAKFKAMVTPGDVLRLEVTQERLRRGIGNATAKAYVGDKLVCQADLTFAIKMD